MLGYMGAAVNVSQLMRKQEGCNLDCFKYMMAEASKHFMVCHLSIGTSICKC